MQTLPTGDIWLHLCTWVLSLHRHTDTQTHVSVLAYTCAHTYKFFLLNHLKVTCKQHFQSFSMNFLKGHLLHCHAPNIKQYWALFEVSNFPKISLIPTSYQRTKQNSCFASAISVLSEFTPSPNSTSSLFSFFVLFSMVTWFCVLFILMYLGQMSSRKSRHPSSSDYFLLMTFAGAFGAVTSHEGCCGPLVASHWEAYISLFCGRHWVWPLG